MVAINVETKTVMVGLVNLVKNYGLLVVLKVLKMTNFVVVVNVMKMPGLVILVNVVKKSFSCCCQCD